MLKTYLYLVLLAVALAIFKSQFSRESIVTIRGLTPLNVPT